VGRNFSHGDSLIDCLAPARETSDRPDAAMQAQNVLATSQFVKSVDILRNQGELGGSFFEFGEGIVAGIWFYFGQYAAAPVIPFPNQLGVARKGGGSGQILYPVLLPEPVGIPKGGHTAFGRDSGAGEYGDGASLFQPLANCLHYFSLAQRASSAPAGWAVGDPEELVKCFALADSSRDSNASRSTSTV
jgi:hypothetical protein